MSTDNKIIRTLPEHGWCFICGSTNPHSLNVRWNLLEDRSILAEVTLTLAQQGPPGYAHGGASAALLDEAMGTAVWAAGHQVVAVNLEVAYQKPVPLDQSIQVTGQVGEKEGRAVHARAEIRLRDGSLAVAGHGVYVEAPQFFDEQWKRETLGKK